ncbi:SGNH/GDSL hydrolase family protein [Chitinophaga sp. 22321]|uniref:SGNH/GDSL hydrolase family protein n=1 Tax=Chitinophaga hostae TaxID=2831022 RepID=A0ABS5J8P6_9BACT|nr:SGNH/GDSL hydrolase family protein [Chitinophaga hostae]MBS0031586.1 SGNH/GDSL hydrolase family protein [Chitinophaga hostae]
MKKSYCCFWLLLYSICLSVSGYAQAYKATYLQDIKTALEKKWPDNKTVNLVFHGHSVPSGYYKTPVVNTLQAYPYLLLQSLKTMYPYAVINIIVTSIGGENSVQGEKRFRKDVLTHQPDVLFIDYALNDQAIGLTSSRAAMEKMIRMALKKKIKVILLTPSPDMRVDLSKKDNPLALQAAQLNALAAQYHIGVADSYLAFKTQLDAGKPVERFMSQVNHPNEEGHQLIKGAILPWFK